ncbi:Hypothetical predicted protein [Cloeon dipterum]|uniref:Uncharacterized protein n=1 Tax=Cloeon dipterum TaxID=197152 RepID=A0A8S1DL14_9INSE|nr:Hypothetical predicted protein [Cloeon dipterum]
MPRLFDFFWEWLFNAATAQDDKSEPEEDEYAEPEVTFSESEDAFPEAENEEESDEVSETECEEEEEEQMNVESLKRPTKGRTMGVAALVQSGVGRWTLGQDAGSSSSSSDDASELW